MYADRSPMPCSKPIDETNRRRAIQVAYNQEHHIEPASVVKAVRDLTDRLARACHGVEERVGCAVKPANWNKKSCSA
jgi:excinuclease ABC subunit B